MDRGGLSHIAIDRLVQRPGRLHDRKAKRAGEMLKSDLEAKGPVRIAEVEVAQKEIVTVARRLADEGAIMLGTGGDDFV